MTIKRRDKLITLLQMQQIAGKYDAEVRYGDYPYAAWYTQKGYNEGEWEGYWFANPSEKPISIYVPKSYGEEQKLFGFFHEIGHIKDYSEGVDFETTWDDEVSAWRNSLDLMINRYKIPFSLDNFRKDAVVCLTTYEKGQGKPIGSAAKEIDSMLDGLVNTDSLSRDESEISY